MYRKCGIAFALIKKDGMLKFFTVCFPKWARVAGYKSDRMNYSKGVISGFFLPRMRMTLATHNLHVRHMYEQNISLSSGYFLEARPSSWLPALCEFVYFH